MKNYNLLLIIVFLLIHPIASAQIHDVFNELPQLPGHWSGNRDSFLVNPAGALQLSASQAGSSYLSTRIPEEKRMREWRFRLRLPFSPSSNNYVRLWLMAADEDLTRETQTGLFLQLGENGNADAIELRRMEQGVERRVCRGVEGRISTPFHFEIKILKDESGHWEIYVDEQLNGYFILDGEGEEHLEGAPYMGLSCHYTASHSDEFFFEEIYDGDPWLDTVPAQLEEVVPQQDLHSILLHFSKALLPGQILYNEYFQIREGGFHPISCQFSDPGCRELLIRFEDPFLEENIYHLQINHLIDVHGNILPEQVAEVLFAKIRRNDILVHEIMPDPTPRVGLPAAEYIELFNRKPSPVILEGWKIQTGSTRRELPTIRLEGNGYALLVAEADRALYQDLPCCHALPTLSLTDGGQQIILYDAEGDVIHTVRFQNDWHAERIKRDGGWSLEMIDSGNPCHGASNWGSSQAPEGGTPGLPNSIARDNRDDIPPEMERISLLDSCLLKLFFSEPVRLGEDLSALFRIDQGVGIQEIEEVAPDFRALLIRTQTPIQPNRTYTLTLSGSIYDCGEMAADPHRSISFGLPSPASKNDLVINEFMTSSSRDGNYVEIYNRSSKIIDLGSILLCEGGDSLPQKAVTAVPGGCQLFPDSYVAICENKETTLEQYHPPFPQRLISNDSFPSYAQSKGVISLTNKSLQPIDRVVYDEDMHYGQLLSLEDVALERIHFEAESSDKASWKSAAASVGYGTPGYRNSQYRDWTALEDAIELSPEIISPDEDGFDDYATLRCQFPDPENRVSLFVFDVEGHWVNTLANNQYCGTEALFTWDGTTAQTARAAPGFYILLLEYWNHQGKSKRVKKVVGVR